MAPSTTDSRQPRSRLRIGCLIALVLFSGICLVPSYPYGAWRIGAAFGTLALVSIFLRVGWFVPFTIAGTYAGYFADATVKGGPIEAQMQETVVSIVSGAIYGFLIGAFIDFATRASSHNVAADDDAAPTDKPEQRSADK